MVIILLTDIHHNFVLFLLRIIENKWIEYGYSVIYEFTIQN